MQQEARTHRPLSCRGHVLDFRKKPCVMGILNTTPDSFYDGGRHRDKALHHALSMISYGADIIDIGGESTRPGAEAVSADEEIRRTAPLIRELKKHTTIPISIDTWKAEVAEEALQCGASIVNDISGFTFDEALPDVCKKYQAAVILMHTTDRPDQMQWSTETGGPERDIVALVKTALEASVANAKAHGIDQIVIDPGFGFGKSVRENFILLKRLHEFHSLGLPVLAGLSRKSFLGHASQTHNAPLPSADDRLAATVSANTIALFNGADILRVHDVSEAVATAAIIKAVIEA